VPCIAEVLQKLGLTFLGLFVQLSTLLVPSFSRFLPALGFYDGRVPVPDYRSLMSSCAWASLLSQLDFQPHTADLSPNVDVYDDLLGNWAHDCVEFGLNARYLLWINHFRLDLSCSASWVSRPRVLIARQLLIDCARYQRMSVLTCSYSMHCVFRRRHFGRVIIEFFSYNDVVKCCIFDIMGDAPPIRSSRMCASD